MDLRLKQRLDRVASRVRSLRLAWRLSFIWPVLALFGAIVWLVARDANFDSASALGPTLAIAMATVAVIVGLFVVVRAWWTRHDLVETAQQIEQRFPTLNEKLLRPFIKSRSCRTDRSVTYNNNLSIQR